MPHIVPPVPDLFPMAFYIRSGPQKTKAKMFRIIVASACCYLTCCYLLAAPGAALQGELPASIRKAFDDFHDTQWAFYDRAQAGQSVPLTLSIRVTGGDFKVGDPVPIEFTLTNTGALDFAWANVRGLEGYDRRYEFALTVQDDSGHTLADPIGDGPPPTGPPPAGGPFSVLKPGESYSSTTYLNSWASVTTPGTFQVSGIYKVGISSRPGETPAKPLSVTSGPISVTVKSRSEAEMDEYVRGLSTQLASIKNPYNGSPYSILARMAFTGSARIAPAILDFLYSGYGGSNYWDDSRVAQTLLDGAPASEEIWKQITVTANQRGLIGSMQTLLEKYDLKLHGSDNKQIDAAFMFPLIARSLAGNNPAWWIAGAVAAARYPSDAFVTRLIALAATPGPAREPAIEALALYRTDETVLALRRLLNDPSPEVRRMTADRIGYAYRSRDRTSDSIHALRDDDFDGRFRQ